MTASTPPLPTPTGSTPVSAQGSRRAVTLEVNERTVRSEVDARVLLVHHLRDTVGVTSPHVGCDTSQCGACTVLMDGRAVKSCTVLAVQADGARITTAEGLSSDAGDGLHPVARALRDRHGLQCGFCTPGMLASAIDLLRRHPHPAEIGEAEVRRHLKGNFCRCTGYQNVVDAILDAARALPSTAHPEAAR